MYQRIFRTMASIILLCGFQLAFEAVYLTANAFVTVDQLGSNASCQYYEKQEEATPSERYGIQLNGIWVTGTCIGTFNVCLGDPGSCCDVIPTTNAATIATLMTTQSISLCQNQDVNSCDLNTAIIAGSTIGGCLFTSASFIGAYLFYRKSSFFR